MFNYVCSSFIFIFIQEFQLAMKNTVAFLLKDEIQVTFIRKKMSPSRFMQKKQLNRKLYYEFRKNLLVLTSAAAFCNSFQLFKTHFQTVSL